MESVQRLGTHAGKDEGSPTKRQSVKRLRRGSCGNLADWSYLVEEELKKPAPRGSSRSLPSMPFAPWANGAARWPAASCVGQPPAGKGGERRQASGAGDGGGQASGAGDGGGRRRERDAGTASGGKREAGTARNNSYFEKKNWLDLPLTSSV